jgi:hypothetical protein
MTPATFNIDSRSMAITSHLRWAHYRTSDGAITAKLEQAHVIKDLAGNATVEWHEIPSVVIDVAASGNDWDNKTYPADKAPATWMGE